MSESGDPRRDTPRLRILAPLRYRDYRLLMTGSLVSLIGDGLFRVAIGIQVLLVQNDTRALAIFSLLWALGMILALPVGGWASDRFERRRVMIAADLARAVTIGVIGVLSLGGELALWHLLVLGPLSGAANGFFNPASSALVPDVLPSEELPRANAFLGAARPAMLWIVGPLIGGVVVSIGGAGSAFVLDAVTFLVSAAMLVRITRLPAAASGDEGLRAMIADVKEGLAYVQRTRWAWAWILALGLSTLAFHGPFDVLVPFLLRNSFGLGEAGVASTMALIFTAGGAGSIAASLALGQWDLPKRFISMMYWAEALGVGALAGFAIMTETWQVLVIGLAMFGLQGISEIIWSTTMQRLVPRNMLGRVASVDWFTAIGLVPISFAIAGFLAPLVGTRTMLAGAGLCGAAAVLALLAVPGARDPEAVVAERVVDPGVGALAGSSQEPNA